MSDETASSSDASVIEASLTDPAAFAVLFDRHAAVIWRYVRRRSEPVLADEVVSETFLRAFAGRARYDLSQLDARPWLYGIATNVLRGNHRGDKRRRRAYALAAERERTDGDLELAEARADAAALAPAVVAAIARLEPIDRETLLLFALTELDYAGIAVATAVPVGTVRSRLHRARRRVRIELGIPESPVTATAIETERGQT